MTPEEIADCRCDLLAFSKAMFKARKGVDMLHNDHMVQICDALERVVVGQCTRLIINIPPRSGKTELSVVNFIAWCMGNFPDSEFIHATYSKRLATANAYAARSIMLHDLFAEIFPFSHLSGDSKAKDEFRTENGGMVYATGADGSITGVGAGKMRDSFGGAIIIDDPHKAGEATSVVRRTNVVDWFTTTMESRKNRPDTPIIVIMQRLHEEDLAGWLLAGGNGEKWTHLNIPAELENGDSFWPRQFPIDDLKRKEASNPYVYAGQYLQRPAPIGGGLFKDEWWKYWRVEPIIEYKMIYADTAMKTGQENDYSVFQCWGMGRDGNIYLLDQLRGKWEAPQLLINAQSFFNKHNQVEWSPLRQMKVEDKASGTGLIQQMSQNGIPVVGIQRNRDKITRAYDVAPMIEAGRVYLPENADFLSEFLLESTQFPNGAHDDQLDPMMDAINDLLIGDAEQSFAFLPNRLM